MSDREAVMDLSVLSFLASGNASGIGYAGLLSGFPNRLSVGFERLFLLRGRRRALIDDSPEGTRGEIPDRPLPRACSWSPL